VKIGDIVKQGGRLVELKGESKPFRGQCLGTVVAIHENLFPEDWSKTDTRKKWAKMIGRRIDVMWSNGKISESFAENSLDVVKEY